MNGRVFSSPVAGFSMTHMSGSKCSMISRALSTSASPSSSRRGRIVRARLGARVWRLHRAYRFACSPFMAGLSTASGGSSRRSVVAEKVVKLTQNAIFGRCCMNPDKFRNTNAYVDPAKFERAVGKSSVTNFELQINDSEGFLAFVETLKTDRSKACRSVPTQVHAAALQAHDGEGLLPSHEVFFCRR